MPTLSRAARLTLAAAAAAAIAGCDSEPAAGAAPNARSTEEREPPHEPPPPEAPTLDALGEPDRARARVAWPEWNEAKDRYAYRQRTMAAAFGTLDEVSLIQLGEERRETVTVTFYGADLEPGDYEVLPSTDETRAEHAGKDSDIVTVTVGKGDTRLLSDSGTLTVSAAGDGAVQGTLDVTVKRDSRIDPAESPFRARFDAERSDWIDSTLEHQASIREQLENR